MAWIPQYTSKGVFSPLVPNGSFQGLKDLCAQYGNFYEVTHGISGNYSTSYWDASGEQQWNGAYGNTFEAKIMPELREKARTGGVQHSGIDMCEIECMKPRGAQYYKHTLVFKGGYECGAKQISTAYIGEDMVSVVYASGEVGISGVYRRVYATPYSQYTETLIDATAQAVPFNFTLYSSDFAAQTNAIWIEPLLWFFLKAYFSVGSLTYNSKKYFCYGFYHREKRQAAYGEPTRYGCGATFLGLDWEYLDTQFDGEFAPNEQEDPYDPGDEPGDGPGDNPEGPGGGGGTGDRVLPDEPVPVPPLPEMSPASISWLTTYCMSKTDIDEFGAELVDPDCIQVLKQFFSDPLDAIVGITMCPVPPHGVRFAKTPRVNGIVPYEWSRSFTVCPQYYELDCGSIQVPPYWDSCFDFAPYTRIYIFLPFVGFREVQADDVMGGSIRVVYHIDCATGDFTVFIERSATDDDIYGAVPAQVIAEYAGNCGVQVPIGRVSHDLWVQSGIMIATGIAGMAVSGLAGMAGSAPSGGELSSQEIGNQVANMSMAAIEGMKIDVQRSGALGGNSGYLGNPRPFLMRVIPRDSVPDNYQQLMGYPCNKGGTLKDFEGSGLAVVEDIQLNNIPAMESERAEIVDWLKKGVLI